MSVDTSFHGQSDEASRNPHGPVEQALFGYQDGHRLLRSSISIKGEPLATLSRLTDGTAAEGYSGFDGYLTGYPLANGMYALTRTWQSPEARRPGAVWTHALLVDSRFLTSLQSPDGLLSLFRRPSGADDLDRYSLPVKYLEPLASDFSVRADWRSTLSALYARDEGTVWRTAETAEQVESDVLALWWWQWPALRRQFSFTLGGTGRRSVSGRDFDMLIVPAARRLSALADFGAPPTSITAAGTLIDADLHRSMPDSFRAYLRFCGSETQRRSAAGLLSDIWMAAEDPDGRPSVVQRRAAERTKSLFPAPTSMRRLKKTLITPDERLPARWDARDSATLLIDSQFGECVSAADVDLDELLFAVRDQPHLLLYAARSLADTAGLAGSDSSRFRSPQASHVAQTDAAALGSQYGSPTQREMVDWTVSDALPIHAQRAVTIYAEPTWLEEIAAIGASQVIAVLAVSDADRHEAWAHAFWTLSQEHVQQASGAYTSMLRTQLLDPESSLGWLAAYASTPSTGSMWLAAAHTSRRSRANAIVSFIDEFAAFSPDKQQPWRAAIRDKALARELVELAPFAPPEHARALLFVADPSAGPLAEAGLGPWAQLSSIPLRPSESAHLLRLARSLDSNQSTLAASAFAEVWEACAKSDWAVWEALGDFPVHLGYGQDWDRARRVTRAFSQTLLSSAPTVSDEADSFLRQTFEVVAQRSPLAASQLSDELLGLVERTLPKPEQKPTGKKKKSKRGHGPLEQARHLASDWLGL